METLNLVAPIDNIFSKVAYWLSSFKKKEEWWFQGYSVQCSRAKPFHTGVHIRVQLTVSRAGQVDFSRHCQSLGIGHLQTSCHATIGGTVDFQSNLEGLGSKKTPSLMFEKLYIRFSKENTRSHVPLQQTCEGLCWQPKGRGRHRSGRWLSWLSPCCEEWESERKTESMLFIIHSHWFRHFNLGTVWPEN